MAVKRSVRRPVERPAQRRRTRKAIVDAAMRLVTRGTTPTVNDVAAEAEVSRRTVYMYFPTFEQLLLDATAGALSQASVDRALESGGDADDVEGRVERMVRAIMTVSPEVERLGRVLIRLTVESDAGHTVDADLPRRGFRRIEWIEAAIEPLRAEIDPATFRRLVNALAMVVGWEPLIVQRDVCGLSADEGVGLSVWAARALLRAALGDG